MGARLGLRRRNEFDVDRVIRHCADTTHHFSSTAVGSLLCSGRGSTSILSENGVPLEAALKRPVLAILASVKVPVPAEGGSMRTFTPGICICFLIVSLVWAALVQADAVTDWNANAGKPASVGCNIQPHESRMHAMMHIAIHDALNAIERRFQPYILDLPETPGASVEAAVATAARDVLVPVLGQLPLELFAACIPAAIDGVEADYAAALNAIADGTSKTQGIVIGRAAAAVVLALRIADGSDTPVLDFSYPDGTEPGEYRSPTGFPLAIPPGWGNVTPFVLKDSAQFRPGPPYAVISKKYTADFDEVKRRGVKEGSTRTPEETQIAYFWLGARPCSGTASRVPSLPRQGSIDGRTRSCSRC